MEMQENKIITCDNEVQYYLNLPHLIVGSIVSFNKEVKYYDEDTGLIVRKEILYSEALMKMIDEVVQNSIDENVRCGGKYSNKIDVTLDRKTNYITISDNGRGIPLKDNMYIDAVTKFRTSSNFNFMKEGGIEKNVRNTAGAHGIGSTVVCALSKDYIMTTIDLEKNKGVVISKDNMSHIETPKITKAKSNEKNGVTITFLPDYARFKLEGLTDDIENHLKAILINIAYANPRISITFQGKKLQVKSFQEFMKYYSEDFSILQDDDKISLAVYPTEEEHQFVYIVNSLDLSKGGNALEYITNNICKEFANRLKKRYSKIQANAVKQKLGVVLVVKNAVNLRFGGGQTKDELKNTVTELDIPTLKYIDFAEVLFKNAKIKNPIIDTYQAMLDYENKQNNKRVKADKKEAFNAKYLKATDSNKYLFICEGDSAMSSLPIALGRKDKGYLPLTGKLMNALKSSNSQLLKNQRIVDIIQCLGIGLEKTRYENLVIASDADLDGIHIACLLVTLIYKLQPELLKEGRVYRLRTPIICCLAQGKNNKEDKLIKWYYDLNSFKKDEEAIVKKGLSIMYIKGLGSLNANHYKTIFEKEGIEESLERIEFNPDREEDVDMLLNWMSEDAERIDYRKDVLSRESFSVNDL